MYYEDDDFYSNDSELFDYDTQNLQSANDIASNKMGINQKTPNYQSKINDHGPNFNNRPMNDHGPNFNNRPMNDHGPNFNNRPMNDHGPNFNNRPMHNHGSHNNNRPNRPHFPNNNYPPINVVPVYPNDNNQMPMAPPPSMIPVQNQTMFRIDSGQINMCMFRNTYVWLNNGTEFWFYPTNVGRSSVAGFRWSRYGWAYIGIELRLISSFTCSFY